MDKKQEICAFDFDGTLTKGDTFMPFLYAMHGRRRVWSEMVKYLPMLVLMKLRLYPNGKAKEKVFGNFCAKMEEAKFDWFCDRFANMHAGIMRPEGMEAVRRAVESGATVIVVTASIDKWVRPFFKEFGNKVTVLGTRLEFRNDETTGRFDGKNCYGPEKARRILELFPDRQSYRLTAYGDSRGDREMLAMADVAHHKPFRR